MHLWFQRLTATIGPLHDPVTWYKIKYTGEQIAQWDFQNNAAAFVLEVPLCNLLTSIRNFVPRDRVVQRAYSLIFGLPKQLIDKLQHLLNAAARLIMAANKYDSITPILKELHWLPVEQRIIFKINLITSKCLNNLAPSYLKELLTLYRPSRTLRSSSDKLRLVTVPYSLKTYGYRSYSVHAPILWNSWPLHIRSADSIHSFKSKLKTYLFKSAYNL